MALRIIARNELVPGRYLRGSVRISARGVASLQASKCVVEKTKKPKEKEPYEKLKFGASFSDHMLEVDWKKDEGWGTPQIRPYGNLSLEPSSSVFHYGMECFEGMKAYLDKDGRARLFRPDMNMRRMNDSCIRIGLPRFDGDELQKLISKLVLVEKDWIPKKRGWSLYLRPTAIATQNSLGVGPSNSSKLFVICSPVGPYFPSGFAPVKLLADELHRRAWDGGIGFTKAGGNYAPTIKPQQKAAEKGFQQILWLGGDLKDPVITEVGTMNMFVLWINNQGEKELITAPLDGTILPGVTRDSILALTRGYKEFKVTEGNVRMADLTKALKEKRVIEAFGAGTACIVTPIELISYQGVEYPVPLHPTDPSKKSGELSQRLMDHIMSIQYGDVPHAWSVVLD